eukprot:5197840-Amphidinium_carterae.1
MFQVQTDRSRRHGFASASFSFQTAAVTQLRRNVSSKPLVNVYYISLKSVNRCHSAAERGLPPFSWGRIGVSDEIRQSRKPRRPVRSVQLCLRAGERWGANMAGLRKKTKTFMEGNYLHNFVQSVFNTLFVFPPLMWPAADVVAVLYVQ